MADQSAQGEPALRALAAEASDRDAVDIPVPEAQVACEEHVKHLDLRTVSHVVVQILDARQKHVFESVGYRLDSNRPTPYWYFLGKIAAQAIYGDPAELLLFNYVRVRTREFIGFTTVMWATAVKAEGVTEVPPFNVIEVDFKKPEPGKPLGLFWKSARGLIADKIRECGLTLDDISVSSRGPVFQGMDWAQWIFLHNLARLGSMRQTQHNPLY